MTLGLAFSAAMASSVVVVSLVMRGESARIPRSAAYDLVDISIINCSSDVLGFFIPVVVLVEPRVGNGIYIDMSRNLGRWFPIVIVEVVHVFGKGGV